MIDQLSRSAVLWQLLSVLVAVLPHLQHMPVWIPLLVVSALGWRMMVHNGRWPFPSRWLKLLLVCVTGVAVLFSYRAGGGISVTVSLLIVGFALKIIEIYTRRDALVVLYVAYLVAATGFLFNQTILMALYLLFALSIITTALLSVYQLRSLSMGQCYRKTCMLLLPALPLMAVLFIGMPRFDPLWEVGLDPSAAKTGLSDRMSPGDISSLIRSPEVAFRATFKGKVPTQSQLYWRALVLNEFDGREWFNSKEYKVQELNSRVSSGKQIQYSLILEPTQKRYVPALAYPAPVTDSKLTRFTDATVAFSSPVVTRQQINLASTPNTHYQQYLSKDEKKRLLYLPEGNPQSVNLARVWAAESASYDEFVGKLLSYFNRAFTYSLTPPLLGKASVDEFLFSTKVGFCGHYASATAFMLRAAGIPARVVTGYQGGDLNPYESYILVRQYDAHAWVEAWYEGRGWVRIDPTAAVAPERIEQPAEDVFAGDESFLAENPLFALSIKTGGLIPALRLRWEAINYGWHQWVLNYHHQQNAVLESILGAVSPLKLALFLLLPFALVIAVTVLILIRRGQPEEINIYDRELNRLSERLVDKGLSRAPGETVSVYCARLADSAPASEQLFCELASAYEQVRYAGVSLLSEQEFSELVNRCLRQLL